MGESVAEHADRDPGRVQAAAAAGAQSGQEPPGGSDPCPQWIDPTPTRSGGKQWRTRTAKATETGRITSVCVCVCAFGKCSCRDCADLRYSMADLECGCRTEQDESTESHPAKSTERGIKADAEAWWGKIIHPAKRTIRLIREQAHVAIPHHDLHGGARITNHTPSQQFLLDGS